MKKEELIRDYLNNKLDQVQTEEMFRTFPGIEDEIEETREVIRAVKAYQLQKEIRETLFPQVTKSRFAVSKNRILALTLAATLLIVSFFTYLSFDHRYFEDLMVSPGQVRGHSDAPKPGYSPFDSFQEGRDAFFSGDFENAIYKFDRALKSNESLRPYFKELVQWNLCVSYLMNQQPEEALRLFNELDHIDDPKFPVNQLTKWKIRWQITLKLLSSEEK
jgi:tetratricopeptide (TPR) repeat protein